LIIDRQNFYSSLRNSLVLELALIEDLLNHSHIFSGEFLIPNLDNKINKEIRLDGKEEDSKNPPKKV